MDVKLSCGVVYGRCEVKLGSEFLVDVKLSCGVNFWWMSS